jgi:hypothetical protein
MDESDLEDFNEEVDIPLTSIGLFTCPSRPPAETSLPLAHGY